MDLVFKALTWSCDMIDTESDHETLIHVGGLTANQETVHLIVHGFWPFAYLELPERASTWKPHVLKKLVEQLKQLGSQGRIKFSVEIPKMGLMYRFLYHRRVPTLFVEFPTMKCMYQFANRIKRRFMLGHGITIHDRELKLHETKTIDPIIKYTSKFKLSTVGWLKTHIKANEHIASTDISAHISYTMLDSISESLDHVTLQPKYISFDIETYSKNHDSKDPDPHQVDNVILQIGLIVGRLGGDMESKQCLTLGETWTDQSYELTCFSPGLSPEDNAQQRQQKVLQAEKRLLLTFFDRIKTINPDVFIGYNIMKFDWPYIIARSKRANILNRLLECGRVYDIPASIGKISWTSSAYGEQSFEALHLHGRLHLDILMEIERNYKFPKYSLNYVSQVLLNEEKDDLTHRELFMIWQFTMDYVDALQRGMSFKDRQTVAQLMMEKLMRTRQTHGMVLKYRDAIVRRLRQEHPTQTLIQKSTRLMGLMADYCVQDCTLPIKLCNHLNIWSTALSMSRVMHVPISYLSTRGQQIRVIAQLVRTCIPEGIFIQSDGYPPYKYQGAQVIEANPGHYQDVFTLDFMALYPSEQESNNLCQTTMLRQDDVNHLRPDQYRTFSIHEHVGCDHDPLKRKKKKEEMYCSDNTFYFRRVAYDIAPDGSYTEHHKGIFPKVIHDLLSSRRAVKKEMAYHEAQMNLYAEKLVEVSSDEHTKQALIELKSKIQSDPNNATLYEKEMVQLKKKLIQECDHAEFQSQYKFHETMSKNKNAEQLAIKVSANSMYGSSGTKEGGVLSCSPIASIITAMGRYHLTEAIKEIQRQIPNIKLVYGDSVVGDTPVLVRHVTTESVRVMAIHQLFNEDQKFTMEGKEYCVLGQYQVWSDGGFVPIKTIMRHRNTKPLYRIISNSGIVTVTEDHSLVTHDGRILKPMELTKEERLLTHPWPKPWSVSPAKSYATDQEAWLYGACYVTAQRDHGMWKLKHFQESIILQLKKQLGLSPYYTLDTYYQRSEIVLPPALIQKHPLLALMLSAGDFPVIHSILLIQGQSFIRSFIKGVSFASGLISNGTMSITVSAHYPEAILDVSKLWWMVESLGYQVRCQYHLTGMYILHMLLTSNEEEPGMIYDMTMIKPSTEYVYDLETGNHHFAAGIGSLVVHNTDSCMLIAQGRTIQESYEIAKQVSKIATHKIKCLIVGMETDHRFQRKDGTMSYGIRDVTPSSPEFKDLVYNDQCQCIEYHNCPMSLEFENMYKNFFLRTKKRYTAYSVDAQGKMKKKTIKGVLTARREGAPFTRRVYDDVDEAILSGQSYDEVMDMIQYHLKQLYGYQLHHSQFVMYMGMKKLVSYAKHVKKPDPTTGKKTIDYYVDAEGNAIVDVTGPLDPRLVYKNMVQSHLGLKMVKRGVELPVSYRLEYLYVDLPSVDQSECAEDYTYYIEHYKDEGWRPDVDYYAKSLLGSNKEKQIVEMLKIKYRGPMIYDWGRPKETFMRVLKECLSVAKHVLTSQQLEYLYAIQNCQLFRMQLGPRSENKMEGKTWVRVVESCVSDQVISESRRQMAKVDAVMALSHDPEHRLWLSSAWQQGSLSLLQAALRHKSMILLNQLHDQYHLPKRKPRRGKHTSVDIGITLEKPKMITVESIESIPAMTLVWVMDRTAIPNVDEAPEGYVRPVTKSHYTYTIMNPECPDHKISGVLREQLISYYYARQHELQHMISYHQSWRHVTRTIQSWLA